MPDKLRLFLQELCVQLTATGKLSSITCALFNKEVFRRGNMFDGNVSAECTAGVVGVGNISDAVKNDWIQCRVRSSYVQQL